jgi:hypothetical protein
MAEIAGAAKPSPLRIVVQSLIRGRERGGRSAAQSGSPSAELARLGSGWHILDDVAAGRSGRLEHLVIGRGGVFAVIGHHDAAETICLGADSLLVGGRRIHHGRAGRSAAADVSAWLSPSVGCRVPVTALVLIVGDRRFVVPRPRDDAVVRMATPAAAVRWVRRRPAAWSAAQVERLCDAAAAPATGGAHSPRDGGTSERARP